MMLSEKYKELARQISDIPIPFGEKIKQIIPFDNLAIRRDLPKILSLTAVIAFIHASNRTRIQDNVGENFIVGSFAETEKRFTYSLLAEPEDFVEALNIAGSAIKQTINKVNETSMKLYGQIIGLYENKAYNFSTLDGEERVAGVTTKEVAKQIGKSENRARELMAQLESAGYLLRDRSTKEHKFVPTGIKFSEIKIEGLAYTKEDQDAWITEQIARHGHRLTVIAPPWNGDRVEDDTK